MRQGKSLCGELEVAKEQQVDVKGARAVARAVEGPAALRLDRLAQVEERLRLQARAYADGRVEEVRLVENLADRLGLVERRDRLYLDAVPAKPFDGRAEMDLPGPDVRAEP